MFFFKHKDKEKPKEFTYTEKPEIEDMKLTSENLKSILSGNEDIVFREISVNHIKITVLYIDGLISNITTSDYILKPLKQDLQIISSESEKEMIQHIEEGNIYFATQQTRETVNDVISDVMLGCTILVFDHEKKAISFQNYGFDRRSISEPTGENVIKGSKDAFVETLRVNTATIRRKIKSPNLKIEQVTIGERTHTPIDIIYMDGITNKKMVEALKERLDKVTVDGVLTTDFVVEFIVDHKYSVFPQVIYTERPDKFCADIIEGRIGLIIDGIPSSIIMPATLIQCLQATEDYSQNYIISSIIRFMRFALMLTTLTLAALYTAITSFHQEMIPSKLATFIETSEEGVPFPAFIEVIFMLIAFEILIEAGVRLPKAIGQAVSIVGAIVVGQAAVEAKLVSPAVVVVIAFTAIASFALPNQDLSNAVRLWRFIFVILASIIGLFGIMFGFLVLLLQLARMEVLGVPYLAPVVSSDYKDLRDTIFRLRLPTMVERPYNLKTEDRQRR